MNERKWTKIVLSTIEPSLVSFMNKVLIRYILKHVFLHISPKLFDLSFLLYDQTFRRYRREDEFSIDRDCFTPFFIATVFELIL